MSEREDAGHFTEHGDGQERLRELNALTLAHLVLQEGVESTKVAGLDLPGIVLITTEEAAADKAVLARMKELGADADAQRRLQKRIEFSLEENGLQASHRKEAVITLKNLAAQDENLRSLDLTGLYKSIESREEHGVSHNSKEFKKPRGRHIINAARRAAGSILIATAAFGPATAATGGGVALYYNTQQGHLPAYASTGERALMIAEVKTAENYITRQPSYVLQVPDYSGGIKNGTSTVRHPARMPDTSDAWMTLQKVQNALDGTQPSTKDVKSVMAVLYNPPQIIGPETFSEQIRTLGRVQTQIKDLQSTPAAQTYRRESKIVVDGLAVAISGVSIAVGSGMGAGADFYFRRRRGRTGVRK
jgi:hypothetical protein